MELSAISRNGKPTGAPGHSITGNHPFMPTGNKEQPANWVRLPAPQIPDTAWTCEKTGTRTATYFYGFNY